MEKTVRKSEKRRFILGEEIGDCIVGDTVKILEPSGNYRYKYECKCKVCGSIKLKTGDQLNKKIGIHHKSCNKEKRVFDKRFWGIYSDAKRRCNDKTRKCYDYYGGKGVKFNLGEYEDFHSNMYNSYKKHCEKHGIKNTTIDRINPLGDYSYDNIKWSTWSEQSKNKVDISKMYQAISKSKTKVTTNDLKPYFKKYLNNEITVNELCQIFKVSKSTICRKLNLLKLGV